MAGWNIAITDGKVKFYDENGALITGDGTKGNGTYTLIKSKAEPAADGGKVWYSIDIPENAKTFSVSYHSSQSTLVTTPVYDIYPYSATDTGENRTENGDMYYQTVSGGSLELMEATYEVTPVPVDYTGFALRGDYLYLVCADKDRWKDMRVYFKDAAGNSVTESLYLTPEYLDYISYDPIHPVDGISSADPNAVGYWFRVPIPVDAEKFVVDSTGDGTTSGDIYRLETPTSVTRYDKDYTLGGMEYRLPDSGTVSTLLYPVFTEIPASEANGDSFKQAGA